MQVKSLSYRTDLIFHRFDASVVDRDAYLVITTPSNPSFWWGNYVLFAEPPQADDFDKWIETFSKEIGPGEQVGHMAFGIDGTEGDTGQVQPFIESGFVLEENVVLTATTVTPPTKYNQHVEIRPLTKAWEWEEAVETQVLYRPLELQESSYRIFKRRLMARYQRMAEAGLGNWFGAFLEGKLVADLGVFFDGEVARYQSVGTHPEYRRRGICGTLVFHAANYAFDTYGVDTLVMVADEHYHAAKVYKSVGFKPTEKSLGLSWYKKDMH